MSCDELGIPHRLRTLGRPVRPFNDHGEVLYRWVSPLINFGPNGELSIAALGDVFRDAADISCNRSTLCDASTDVLYNPDRLPHRSDHSVIYTSINDLQNKEFAFSLPNTPAAQISFEVEHVPEPCMYPHSQIVVMRDSVRLANEVKPKTLRTKLRAELAPLFTRCHVANPNFQLESVRRTSLLARVLAFGKNLLPWNWARTLPLPSPIDLVTRSLLHVQR